MTDRAACIVLDQQRRQLGRSIEECWAAYFALGGRGDLPSLRAFFDGDLAFAQIEIDTLAAAIADLASLSEPAQRSSIIQASRALTSPPAFMVSDAADRVAQLIAEQLDEGPDGPGRGAGGPWGPIRLADVGVLIRSGRTTTVRTAPPSLAAGLLELGSEGGSLLRIDTGAPDWERHPGGDELLVLLSGEAHVEIDDSLSATATLRSPFDACVIPKGRWHRHLAATADTRLIFLTPTEVAGDTGDSPSA